jgi:hypothetical protein
VYALRLEPATLGPIANDAFGAPLADGCNGEQSLVVAQVSWSVADLTDGGAHPEAGQTMPCGTFFANLCGFSDTQITQLLDLPPSAPPPPTLPEASLDAVPIVDVRASGGFDAHPPPSAPPPPMVPPSPPPPSPSPNPPPSQPPHPPSSPPPPDEGWVPVSCAMLTWANGASDPQCATPVCVDDAQGRAVLSESHVDPPGTAIADMTIGNGCFADNHCHTGCGCVSRWELSDTASGGALAAATSIRYRQVFSGRGSCYNVLGYHRWGATGGWATNMREAAGYTIEWSPPGSEPEDFAASYTHNSNNWHQFSNCGAPGCDKRFWGCTEGADHTSVYVYEHARNTVSNPFDLTTSNGVCGGYGSWRYEAVELYVPPYTIASGRRLQEVTVDPLADCTDDAGTPCVAYSNEHAWLMFDVGTQNDRLYSAQLILMPPEPPYPPSAPPPPPPLPPPSPLPPPPPAPSPSPPPPPQPPPDTLRLCKGNFDRDDCTFDTVSYTSNGLCEDGGAGSMSGKCEYGADLTDCGFRMCPGPYERHENVNCYSGDPGVSGLDHPLSGHSHHVQRLDECAAACEGLGKGTCNGFVYGRLDGARPQRCYLRLTAMPFDPAVCTGPGADSDMYSHVGNFGGVGRRLSELGHLEIWVSRSLARKFFNASNLHTLTHTHTCRMQQRGSLRFGSLRHARGRDRHERDDGQRDHRAAHRGARGARRGPVRLPALVRLGPAAAHRRPQAVCAARRGLARAAHGAGL